MPIDAIVFDLGGVLVEVDIRRALRHWAALSGVPVDAIVARWKQDQAYSAHECGRLTDREYFAHLRARLDLTIGETDMLAGWNAVLGEPLPGVEAIVRQLGAHYPLYVFSNTNPAHVAHFTPRYERLLRLFRETITSCALGSRKPEPEAFRRVAERIGARPERLVFFDDREDNVSGARQAGWQAFHVSSADDTRAISEALLAGRRAG